MNLIEIRSFSSNEKFLIERQYYHNEMNKLSRNFKNNLIGHIQGSLTVLPYVRSTKMKCWRVYAQEEKDGDGKILRPSFPI